MTIGWASQGGLGSSCTDASTWGRSRVKLVPVLELADQKDGGDDLAQRPEMGEWLVHRKGAGPLRLRTHFMDVTRQVPVFTDGACGIQTV